jgi:hypothetical protein
VTGAGTGAGIGEDEDEGEDEGAVAVEGRAAGEAPVEVRWQPVAAPSAGADARVPRLDTVRAGSGPAAAIVDLPALEPGAWRWSTRPLAEAGAAGGPDGAAAPSPAAPDPAAAPAAASAPVPNEREGRVMVEAATDELRWPRDTLLLQHDRGGDAAAAGHDPGAIPRFAPPLRTVPWLWLFVLLALSAEWILRRRLGLR